MFMKIHDKILKQSKYVDRKYANITANKLDSVKITFNVPKFHPRSKLVKRYIYAHLPLENLIHNKTYLLTKNHIFIIDRSVSEQPFVQKFIKNNDVEFYILQSIENKVKTVAFLDDFIKKNGINKKSDFTLIVIGGGLLLNIGAYIAERTSSNLIQIPTTILSMADSAGGKVRVNFLSENRAYKHFYKSFFEPNAIFFDERFINSLSERQKKIGIVEIIKHGIFQSPKLYDYLMKIGPDIFNDTKKMKKAILWSVELKKIAIEIDVEENENGSRRILRGGHDFSDRIEEDSKFSIPHGIAVAIGIVLQLRMEGDETTLDKAIRIFNHLKIPYTLEDFNKWK